MRLGRSFQGILALAVAIVPAATATAVYRSAVPSAFEPIRVEVVGSEIQSSHRAVVVTLPAWPARRAHAAVLGVRVRNLGQEQRELGLSVHGLPKHRIVVPAEGRAGRDVVLSPGIVRALAPDARDRARSLVLTGDADGWAVTAVEVRNYHVRAGSGVMAVVVPERAEARASDAGLFLLAIVLSLLALAQAVAPQPRRSAVRLVGHAAALAAFVLCATVLIVPLCSSYTVLLSPSAFALIAIGLFAPLLLSAAGLVIALARPMVRRAFAIGVAPAGAVIRRSAVIGRSWRAHAVTFERGAALLGLVAIGIVHPPLDVVSNSPEFFAARGTALGTAIWGIVAVSLGLPLLLLAIERAIRALSPRAAAAFFGIVLALLIAAMVMPWLRRADVVRSPREAAVAVVAGLALALAYLRVGAVRQFFTALAPATIVVPGLLFLEPRVVQTFMPSESPAAVMALERTPPIVFVIFDELPLNSLLGADGSIDAERYPNFATLARDSYWFRNASTVSALTSYAVPAILSGQYPLTSEAVPTLRYYPVNLFSTLSRRYQIVASLKFQKLCPLGACQHNSGDTLRLLLSDLGLVWMHIVLPPAFTETLPPVDEDWADFGAAPAAPKRKLAQGRGGVFAEFLASIDSRPGRLHFIHSMLPHMPFEYVPSGRRYTGSDRQFRTEQGVRLFEKASAAYADAYHQRHLAQVGFVDRLVGDLLRRLRDVDAYDRALVVVTADHGASHREGRARRVAQPQNLLDIIHVPLFIKLPGQRQGQVVDRIVENVDVLPTILDVLGAKVSLPLDGRSLFGRGVPDRSVRSFVLRNRTNAEKRTVRESPEERASSVERKLRRFGSGDHMGLYAPPGARPLLGVHVAASGLRPATDVHATVRDLRRFASVKLDEDPLPLYVDGTLDISKGDPLDVAIIVNGVVAAVCQSYQQNGRHVFTTLIPESSLRDGDNSVAAIVLQAGSLTQASRVDREGGAVRH